MVFITPIAVTMDLHFLYSDCMLLCGNVLLEFFFTHVGTDLSVPSVFCTQVDGHSIYACIVVAIQ